MRSLLFAPGDSDGQIVKAAESGADALLLDLADSVALEAKPRARARVAEYLAATPPPARGQRLYVRVNPFDSDLTETDLDAIMAAAPDGIVLPRCVNGADVQRLGAKLAPREAEHGLADGATRILALATASARAIFGLASYAGCSRRLVGLAWAAEDLSADLGSRGYRVADGGLSGPYRLARELALFAAVAAEVAPIDAIFADFRDETGLREECEAASHDGFVAKLAIHPAQVPVINEAFTPAPAALALASAIVAGFDAAPGTAMLAIDGQMYGPPQLKRARILLARASLT